MKQASNPRDIAEVIYDVIKDLDFIEKEKILPIVTELVKLHAENAAEGSRLTSKGEQAQ